SGGSGGPLGFIDGRSGSPGFSRLGGRDFRDATSRLENLSLDSGCRNGASDGDKERGRGRSVSRDRRASSRPAKLNGPNRGGDRIAMGAAPTWFSSGGRRKPPWPRT